jgi:hypothetical protein
MYLILNCIIYLFINYRSFKSEKLRELFINSKKDNNNNIVNNVKESSPAPVEHDRKLINQIRMMYKTGFK